MGHFCWVCGRIRSNESFSGKGHARHQCRECSKLPKSDLVALKSLDFIHSVLFRQSNISPANLKTLAGYLESPRAEVREWAGLALEVGRVQPRKKRRYILLKARHPELLTRLCRLFPEQMEGIDFEQRLGLFAEPLLDEPEPDSVAQGNWRCSGDLPVP